MSKTFDLSVSRTIPAPCKDVFDAWLDPAALTRFMCPGEGMTVSKAESDARVGGAFLIVMKAGETEMPHRGEYTVIDRHSTLAFTWLSQNAAAGSVVTVTFEERGPRETSLTLKHVGLVDEQSRDNHTGGWNAILDRLAGIVS